MDEKTKQEMAEEILDKINAILYKEDRDVEKDCEAIGKLLDEAKEKGLI